MVIFFVVIFPAAKSPIFTFTIGLEPERNRYRPSLFNISNKAEQKFINAHTQDPLTSFFLAHSKTISLAI